MKQLLISTLKFELQLLKEMLSLSESQKLALIKFNTVELDRITFYQNEIAVNLRLAEEKRIKFLMSTFKISRTDAINMTMTEITKNFSMEENKEFIQIRKELKKLINQIHNNNIVNRVLANRARASVREMLGFFTNGTNQVCNVRI